MLAIFENTALSFRGTEGKISKKLQEDWIGLSRV